MEPVSIVVVATGLLLVGAGGWIWGTKRTKAKLKAELSGQAKAQKIVLSREDDARRQKKGPRNPVEPTVEDPEVDDPRRSTKGPR